ncbi:unnamed protein product, partial [Symbiodinium sp. CCMP2456]
RSLLKSCLPAWGRQYRARTTPRQELCRRFGATVSESCLPTSGMECMFGRRYYGRPLREIVSENPEYCRWMLQKAEEDGAPSGLLENAAWLTLHAPLLKVPRDLVRGGKHRGRLLSELVQEDPFYCKWVLREAKVKDALPSVRESASWLEQNAPHLKNDHPVPGFLSGGKHGGRALSDLVTEDPAYCQWILRAAKAVQPSKAIREAADWLVQNAPNLKQDQALRVRGRKHHGRLVSELVSEDPGYCQWLLRTAEDQDADQWMTGQAAWLLANAPHLKETTVVTVRCRHRGIPLPQVVAEDPHWCIFALQPLQERSRGFVEASAWLRENAAELLQVREDDEEALTEIGRTFLGRYGNNFVLRTGKHRMKTFQTVIKEAPTYVDWAESRIRNASASQCKRIGTKNLQLLAAFARLH